MTGAVILFSTTCNICYKMNSKEISQQEGFSVEDQPPACQ